MNTELEILRKIWKNKEKVQVRLIAKQTGWGIDYVWYICKSLLQKDLVRYKVRGQYLITHKGQKELEKRGLIKLKLSSRKMSSKILKRKRSEQKWTLPTLRPLKETKVKTPSSKIKLNPSYSQQKTEKLNLGRKVEKAILTLTRLKRTKKEEH